MISNKRFIEASKYLPAWRNALRLAAEGAVAVEFWSRTSEPVELEVMFYLERPATVPFSKRAAPTVPPDLDKLIRAVGDALTGVVYDDDSQIVRVLAWKTYADARAPGAFIRVNELSQSHHAVFQSLDFLDLPD
jgi:crossover junction endodeoxyribonuclease RusA